MSLILKGFLEAPAIGFTSIGSKISLKKGDVSTRTH